MILNDSMDDSGILRPENYSFCVLWEEKKAPVIIVHISWVFLKVLIRRNYLDSYFLFGEYGLSAHYVPAWPGARQRVVT